ncbi:MAG: protein translocase subunit SecF [bacterium]|nr:protein translocase subunit SecF [bacterium]
MNIIAKSKIWLSIMLVVTLTSIIFFVVFGLKLGIDFTGGSLLEVNFSSQRPDKEQIEKALSGLNLGGVLVQPVDEANILLRFKDVDEDTHQRVLESLKSLSADGGIEELRFESVGPSVGKELKRRSVYAMVIVLIVIIAYIAWSFRKVSKPLASWKYGVAAVVALFHDVLLVIGVFSILGRYYGVEVDVAFIAAILTVLGYSINDTIVVFDRIRENLPRSNEDFAGTVNTSINQTLVRSLNTSITTLLVLVAIFFFGGDSIHYFVLALIIGISAGAYSSIFIASPIVVEWEKMQKK